MSVAASSVSAVVATGVICLVVGIGLGSVGTMAVEASKNKQGKKEDGEVADTPDGGETKAPPKFPGAGKGGKGGFGGGKGGFGGGKGGGMFKVSSRNQLAGLVVKLDQLTQKPLTVSLSAEQRGKLAALLEGLDKEETLSEDEAKKRLDAILEIVKDDRKTMEAAGYRWPGEGGGFRRPSDAPNPFKEEENDAVGALKSLRATSGKEK